MLSGSMSIEKPSGTWPGCSPQSGAGAARAAERGCWSRSSRPFSGLAWLRDRVDIERLGAGFGLSHTTAYRYRDEVLEVVSDQAPDLQQALKEAKAAGCAFLIGRLSMP